MTVKTTQPFNGDFQMTAALNTLYTVGALVMAATPLLALGALGVG